jgi:hypothetical protein
MALLCGAREVQLRGDGQKISDLMHFHSDTLSNY